MGKETGGRGEIIQEAWAQRQGFGYLINRGCGYRDMRRVESYIKIIEGLCKETGAMSTETGLW